ncbi:MAG: LytR C-terminal domain-containing protein [Actinomycetota bacterium]
MPGRHSTDDEGAYVRSLIGWFVPWALVALVVGAGIVFLVDWAGEPEIRPPAASEVRASPSPSATPTEIVLASPSPKPSPTQDEQDTQDEQNTQDEQDEQDDRSDVKLITKDVNVQVLNATSDPDAADRMAQKLTQLGYRVESVEGASGSYRETTVFWSYAGARRAGEALAARFDWVVEEKPSNLSAEVAIHVVVGADEAG